MVLGPCCGLQAPRNDNSGTWEKGFDTEGEVMSMVGNQSLTTTYPLLTSAVPAVTVNCLNQSEKFTRLWGSLSSRSPPVWHQGLLGWSSLVAYGVGAGCVSTLQALAGFSLSC